MVPFMSLIAGAATTAPAVRAFGWVNSLIVVMYLAGMVTIGHFAGRRRAAEFFRPQRLVESCAALYE